MICKDCDEEFEVWVKYQKYKIEDCCNVCEVSRDQIRAGQATREEFRKVRATKSPKLQSARSRVKRWWMEDEPGWQRLKDLGVAVKDLGVAD